MKMCNIRYIFVATLSLYTSAIYAQQVPQVAVVPGGNNAYAAGYSVANVLQPRFPTTAPGSVLYAPPALVPDNPMILVGPLPGVPSLLAPVTPFLNQSYFFGGRE